MNRATVMAFTILATTTCAAYAASAQPQAASMAVASATTVAAAQPAPTAPAAPVAASIGIIKGTVKLLPQGTTLWAQSVRAAEGMALAGGDRLQVGALGEAEIVQEGGSVSYLRDNTEAELSDLKFEPKKKSALASVQVFFGRLLASVSKGKVKNKYTVRSPAATVAVRGTDLAVAVGVDGTSDIAVYEGEVYVRTISEMSTGYRGLPGDATELLMEFLHDMSLKSGQQTRVTKAGKMDKPKPIAADMQENKDRLEKLKGRIAAIRQAQETQPQEERWAKATDIRSRVLAMRKRMEQTP